MNNLSTKKTFYENLLYKYPSMSRFFRFRYSIPVSMVMAALFVVNFNDYYNPYNAYEKVYDIDGYPDYANNAVIFFCKDSE